MPELDLEWDESLDEAFDALEAEITSIVRGMAVEMWDSILTKTPQFYGRMAASWSFSLDTPEFADRTADVDFVGPRKIVVGTFEPSTGLYRGHPEAIAVANRANLGRDLQFRLGKTIWMANGVNHGEGPYSQAVENGGVNLRAVNRPGAPVERSVDMINARYGDDVTRVQAERLKLHKIEV